MCNAWKNLGVFDGIWMDRTNYYYDETMFDELLYANESTTAD